MRRFERREALIANARLAVFCIAVVVAVVIFRAARGSALLSLWWLAAPAVAFVVLLVVHDRVIRRRRRAERAVAFYERGLARLEDRWAGEGDAGERFAEEDHPYAADLDLFGSGSLFELLCTARTGVGARQLARWLLQPAAVAAIRERQQAIDELRDRIDLREQLAVLGERVGSAVDPDALVDWAAAPPLALPRGVPACAGALSFLTVVALVSWLGGWSGWWWLLAALAVQGGFTGAFRRRVRRVIAAVEQPAHALPLLAVVLERMEREPFTSPELRRLQRELLAHGRRASHRIAQLSRHVAALDA
ncbi:MAG: DNA mismatch repair protein MutS, partial [Acidobacteriota bacterium]